MGTAGRIALAALVLTVPASAGAQIGPGGIGRYESLYGPPVDVSLDDLLQNPDAYRSRAVRTHGSLDNALGSFRAYVLRAAFGARVRIVPMADIALRFEDDARSWVTQELHITGVVEVGTSGPATGTVGQVGTEDGRILIRFWGYTGPDERDHKKAVKAPTVTLESLLSSPGRRDGQAVRVVGKFRGHNLYGDLPNTSRRRSADWVIKDDVFAVWVTGKKPKGSGWELDAALKRDTGKWVEVVGRPETRRGVVYLLATQVALGKPPSPTAEAKAPPPPPPRPKVAPVVVFALPLDREQDVSPDTTRLMVQFSKDMDEATFEGRVRLRYVDGTRPGERPFDGVKLAYDRGRRVLSVDPGDVLREGRELQLLLLPGIRDTDGLELAPLQPSGVDGAVAVLRWTIAG